VHDLVKEGPTVGSLHGAGGGRRVRDNAQPAWRRRKGGRGKGARGRVG
jgi:hypothetical protein